MRTSIVTRLLAVVLACICTVTSTATAANDFRIDYHVKNYPLSDVAPRLDPEGFPVFQVNTVPIPTYSDQSTLVHGANGAFDMWCRAPFSGSLFRSGQNQISIFVGTQVTAGVHMDNHVYLRGPGIDRLLFEFTLTGQIFTGSTSVSLSLREIDPQLADSLSALKAAIEEASRRLLTAAEEADERTTTDLDRLAELEALIDELLDRGWDRISPEELDALLAQYDDLLPGVRDALVRFLEDLRQNVEELRDEIARISEVYRQQAEAIDNVVGAAPTWDPGDPTGFEPIEDGEMPPIDLPEVFDEPWDPTHDPYRRYADEIIASLQRTVSQDGPAVVVHRADFLSIYEAWRYNIENLELVLQMRSVVSVAEWGAFLSAKTRVLGFLRAYIGDDGWLHDAYVPPDVKAFVRFLRDLGVASQLLQRATPLQRALNLWQGPLTEQQRAILDVLSVLYTVTRERRAQGAPEEDDGFWSSVGDIVDGAISLTPIGDFLDLCRAVGGKENCISGRSLSIEERALSGLGVLIGSGAAWKAAASSVSGVAVGAVRKVGDVLDEIPSRRPRADIVDEIPHSGGAVTYVHLSGLVVRYNRRGFPDFSPYLYSGPKKGSPPGLVGTRIARIAA